MQEKNNKIFYCLYQYYNLSKINKNKEFSKYVSLSNLSDLYNFYPKTQIIGEYDF